MKRLMGKIRMGINNMVEWRGTPYIVLTLFGILLLIPFYWVLVTSLKPTPETYLWPPTLIPQDPTLSAYKFALIYSPVGKYLLNSTLYSFAVAVVVLVIGTITIYGLTFYPYKGSNRVLYSFFMMRVIPPQSLWLPFLIIFSSLGLTNSRFPVIIFEIALVYPLAIWMFKGLFDAFPREIVDSATIDGCSRLGALYRVVIPVATPAIAAIGIIAFLWSWNEFMFPYLVLHSRDLWPVTVGVFGFLGEEGVMWNALSATQILAILPGLAFFTFAQKHIVAGLTAGSVKG